MTICHESIRTREFAKFYRIFALLLAVFNPLAVAKLSAQSPDHAVTARGNTGRIIGDCGTVPDATGRSSTRSAMVYKSAQSIVCADYQFWSSEANAAAVSSFFPYLDAVVDEDKKLFPVKTPNAHFVFQLISHPGGAHTGCNFPKLSGGVNFCDTVPADSFTNVYTDPVSRARIQGFWGYLLPLHESAQCLFGSPLWRMAL